MVPFDDAPCLCLRVTGLGGINATDLFKRRSPVDGTSLTPYRWAKYALKVPSVGNGRTELREAGEKGNVWPTIAARAWTFGRQTKPGRGRRRECCPKSEGVLVASLGRDDHAIGYAVAGAGINIVLLFVLLTKGIVQREIHSRGWRGSRSTATFLL